MGWIIGAAFTGGFGRSRLIGFRPEIDLAKGLAREWEWIQEVY